METLPVELLRLIYAYCDPPSVRGLRRANRNLAEVGYEYLLGPKFTAVSYRNDIDRLHNIALHDQLRGSIESILINFAELSEYDAKHGIMFSRFTQFPDERAAAIKSALDVFTGIVGSGRKTLDHLHTRTDDLREAFTSLPNLKDVDITFTQCPVDDEILRGVYDLPSCRKMDRALACKNLDAIIYALHGVRLNSFSIDRFPLEVFKSKSPISRNHWFTHARSFDSLSRLRLTMDPSSLQGPASAHRAINGLGHLLQLASRLRHLKLAFHPYLSSESKFALSFRELLNGFRWENLDDLILEGISCDEDDLKEFLTLHGDTLTRLRLGGPGLAKPYERSLGGIHLYEGSFKSLFTGLRAKLPRLERLHLEGIFECENGLPSHETYNFYPLTNENWEEVPRPGWVRPNRKTIDCTPFEHYVLFGGPYPGGHLLPT